MVLIIPLYFPPTDINKPCCDKQAKLPPAIPPTLPSPAHSQYVADRNNANFRNVMLVNIFTNPTEKNDDFLKKL